MRRSLLELPESGPTRHRGRPFRRTFFGVAVVAVVTFIVGLASAGEAYAAATMSFSGFGHTCGTTDFQVFDFSASGLVPGHDYALHGSFTSPNYNGMVWQGVGFIANSGGSYSASSINFSPQDGTTKPDAGGQLTISLYDDFNDPQTLEATVGPNPLAACPNQPPVSNNDSFNVPQDTPAALNVLANDTDADGNTLSVTNLTQPSHGTVSLNGNQTVQYAPNAGYSGPDQFTYTANDGTVNGNVATVSITVQAVQQGPPTAVDDSVVVTRHISTTINVLANDTVPDANGLTVNIASQPTMGSAVVDSSNQVVYVAGDNVGADSFTYQVCDSHSQCDTATVHLTIRYEPDFGIAKKFCASPHKANGSVVLKIGNIADGAGADTDVVSLGGNNASRQIADGDNTTVQFGKLAAGSYTYQVAQQSGATVHQGFDIKTCKVVNFKASIVKYADSNGKAVVHLNNYWSGKSVVAIVKDGRGDLHKYTLAKFEKRTVRVPTRHQPKSNVAVYLKTPDGKQFITSRNVLR